MLDVPACEFDFDPPPPPCPEEEQLLLIGRKAEVPVCKPHRGVVGVYPVLGISGPQFSLRDLPH